MPSMSGRHDGTVTRRDGPLPATLQPISARIRLDFGRIDAKPAEPLHLVQRKFNNALRRLEVSDGYDVRGRTATEIQDHARREFQSWDRE